jgi:hypothetical protein
MSRSWRELLRSGERAAQKRHQRPPPPRARAAPPSPAAAESGSALRSTCDLQPFLSAALRAAPPKAVPGALRALRSSAIEAMVEIAPRPMPMRRGLRAQAVTLFRPGFWPRAWMKVRSRRASAGPSFPHCGKRPGRKRASPGLVVVEVKSGRPTKVIGTETVERLEPACEDSIAGEGLDVARARRDGPQPGRRRAVRSTHGAACYRKSVTVTLSRFR